MFQLLTLAILTGLQERLYKVLITGDVAVGKTSLVRRYVLGVYSNKYKNTIGVDFALKSLYLFLFVCPSSIRTEIERFDGSDVDINMQLWDIAGSERLAAMTRVCVASCNCFVSAFSLFL